MCFYLLLQCETINSVPDGGRQGARLEPKFIQKSDPSCIQFATRAGVVSDRAGMLLS
jgi:hypothetical protein